MDSRYLPMLFFVNLMLVTAHAALSPQLYWKMMLPNTPMPKSIKEFVKHGEYLGHMQKETIDDQNARIMMWGKSTGKQLQDKALLHDDTKESESQSDAAIAHHPKKRPEMNHQIDDVKVDLIFFEDGLSPGTKMDAHFNKTEYRKPLLPRQVAQRIPFSSEKINEILQILSVKPNSEMANAAETQIRICEGPPRIGDEKFCATSLESMLDYVISRLGNNLRAFATYAEKEGKPQKFLVKNGVKTLAEGNVIACHLMDYPYAVFFCHHLEKTTTHFMPLEGEDGTRVQAVVVCHRDTSFWDPDNMELQALKVRPGDCPVCHIFPEVHVVFTK
ncbi:BURP domain-containing protein 3-like [Abrus precatorius]|uniref:BURP domain-containing protein 3-like n=1 Tax=Abrus precatorius TaxID=3816 RepID=A0A8B8K1S1_ABRPR|nr:BURP domain-containing protein 3-like [Abrus precatorius]